eukprot:NODE_87_length_21893_cov_0.496559.p2 type:complete len:872 gc:universal NODE_87_length_21893_cov_0.496559:9571-6956(-)
MIDFDAPFYIQTTSGLIEKLKLDSTYSEHQALQIENEYLEKMNLITFQLNQQKSMDMDYKSLQMEMNQHQSDLDILEIKLLASPRFAEMIKEVSELQRQVDMRYSNQFEMEIENLKLLEVWLQEQESIVEIKRQQRELLEPLLKSQLREYLTDIRDKEQEINSKLVELEMSCKEIEEMNSNISEFEVKYEKLSETRESTLKEIQKVDIQYDNTMVALRSSTTEVNKQEQVIYELSLQYQQIQATKSKLEFEKKKTSVEIKECMDNLNECDAMESELVTELSKADKELNELDERLAECKINQKKTEESNKDAIKRLFLEEKKHDAFKKELARRKIKISHLLDVVEAKTKENDALKFEMRSIKLDKDELQNEQHVMEHQKNLFLKKCVEINLKLLKVSNEHKELAEEHLKYTNEIKQHLNELNDSNIKIKSEDSKLQKLIKSKETDINKLHQIQLDIEEKDNLLKISKLHNKISGDLLSKELQNKNFYSNLAKRQILEIKQKMFAKTKKEQDLKKKSDLLNKLQLENQQMGDEFLKTVKTCDVLKIVKSKLQHNSDSVTDNIFKLKDNLEMEKSKVANENDLIFDLKAELNSNTKLLHEADKEKRDSELFLIQIKKSVLEKRKVIASLKDKINDQDKLYKDYERQIKIMKLKTDPLESYFKKYGDCESQYYETTAQLEQLKRNYLILQDKICNFKIESSQILIQVVGKDISEQEALSKYHELVKICNKLHDQVIHHHEQIEQSQNYLLGLEIDYFTRRQDLISQLIPKNRQYKTQYEQQVAYKSAVAEYEMFVELNQKLKLQIDELQYKLEHFEPTVLKPSSLPDLPSGLLRPNAYIPNDDEQLPVPFLYKPFVSVPNRKVKQIKMVNKPVVI